MFFPMLDRPYDYVCVCVCVSMYRPWVEVQWRDKREKSGEGMIMCGERKSESEKNVLFLTCCGRR